MALEKTFRWFGEGDSVTLSDIRQLGVEGVVTALHHIPNGEIWPVEEILKVQAQIQNAGLRWSVVESLPVSEAIKTCSTDRARHIANYCESLKNLGECGIDTVCYNFMPVLDWARTDIHYKTVTGGESMLFDFASFVAFDAYILKRKNAENDYSSQIVKRARSIFESMSEDEAERLAHTIIVVTQGFIDGVVGDNEQDYKEAFLNYLNSYKDIDAEKLKENLALFINDIMPVADEYNIKMCIHPDDPPFSVLGLPRIVSTLDDIQWVLSQNISLNHGVTFCAGSLSARHDNDLIKMVSQVGDRIHFIHLRNTQLKSDGSFHESGHLNGSVDMYEIMSALLKEQRKRIDNGRSDFRMPMRPDHGIKMLDDYKHNTNPGYPLIGRLKGLAELTGLEYGIERNLDQ